MYNRVFTIWRFLRIEETTLNHKQEFVRFLKLHGMQIPMHEGLKRI